MPLPKLIAIVGPTAAGKTDVGIALARAFDGEVIAADSRTIFRGLNIGTAKPVGERLLGGQLTDMVAEKPLIVEGILHWGLDIVNPDEVFTVAEYRIYADSVIQKIIQRGHVPLLVGGTGLYVRSLLDRPTYTEVPPNESLRLELAMRSNAELMQEIEDRDPDTASTIDKDNRRRLERAVEILRATGKTLGEVQKFEEPKYDALQIGIEVDREQLYQRIDERVDIMVAKGLVDEVRELYSQYGPEAPALTGIGYRQIVEFLQGKTLLREAIARIKYDSHHYAKRQETWFRRDPRVVWVKDAKAAITQAQEFLQAKTEV